jgi:hypothetical protein
VRRAGAGKGECHIMCVHCVRLPLAFMRKGYIISY